MIDRFDQALCALQSATFGREIYGADHPQVATQVTRAATLLQGMLAQRQSLTFMAFDDRVVFDDRRLPSGTSLASGLIARLRRHGVECVTFSAGLTEPELTGWLSHFDKDAPADAPAANTPHIRVGSIDGGGEGEPEDGVFNLDPDGAAGFDPGRPGDVEGRIFGTSAADGPDMNAVGALIEDLSHSVAGAAGALLPLASLKHHDEYTSVHTINVAMMSIALAQQVGLSADRVHEIAVGAVLHDLGKRDVPPAILNKPGKLTEAEFSEIRAHPAAGARALLEMKGVTEVAVIIAYEHHMHLDGTGYPDARGRTPHLCSRIVQLADIYDALRTHRPYRPALPLAEATRIMREGAGSKYDADLLDMFFDRVAVRARREAADAA